MPACDRQMDEQTDRRTDRRPTTAEFALCIHCAVKTGAARHGRVLPPGELNGITLEPMPLYLESFTTMTFAVFPVMFLNTVTMQL